MVTNSGQYSNKRETCRGKTSVKLSQEPLALCFQGSPHHMTPPRQLVKCPSVSLALLYCWFCYHLLQIWWQSGLGLLLRLHVGCSCMPMLLCLSEAEDLGDGSVHG